MGLIEEILQIIKEFLPFWGGFSIQRVVKLAQKLLLFLGQLGGRLYHHREVMIAPALGIAHLGDALAGKDELPAGLVEPNEDRLQAAKRELSEETGATVLSIKKVLDCSFTSAGMSDETIEMYVAEVSLSGKQNLDETELIEIVKVPLDQLDEFLSTHTMCTGSALLAKYFAATLK